MSTKAVLSVTVQISPKTFGGYDDAEWRESVRDYIITETGPWNRPPVSRALVVLEFSLKPERLVNGNDLDNLSKLTLDALSSEIKYRGQVWKGYGVILNDSYIVDLVLRKKTSNTESIEIKVFEWQEGLLEKIFHE